MITLNIVFPKNLVLPGQVVGSPALSATLGLVFIGSLAVRHDAVCVISKYRRFTMDTDASAMPLIGPDSSVVVASDDCAVICVDGASGAVRWNITVGGTTSGEQCTCSMVLYLPVAVMRHL